MLNRAHSVSEALAQEWVGIPGIVSGPAAMVDGGRATDKMMPMYERETNRDGHRKEQRDRCRTALGNPVHTGARAFSNANLPWSRVVTQGDRE